MYLFEKNITPMNMYFPLNKRHNLPSKCDIYSTLQIYFCQHVFYEWSFGHLVSSGVASKQRVVYRQMATVKLLPWGHFPLNKRHNLPSKCNFWLSTMKNIQPYKFISVNMCFMNGPLAILSRVAQPASSAWSIGKWSQ